MKPGDELNRPETTYKKKLQIRHFNSFELMNEADAQENAAISPLMHLHATRITKKVFSEELKQPMDKTIKFK